MPTTIPHLVYILTTNHKCLKLSGCSLWTCSLLLQVAAARTSTWTIHPGTTDHFPGPKFFDFAEYNPLYYIINFLRFTRRRGPIKLWSTSQKVEMATATEVSSHGLQLPKVGTKVLSKVGQKLAIVKHPNTNLLGQVAFGMGFQIAVAGQSIWFHQSLS